jgi:hypothetical protein
MIGVKATLGEADKPIVAMNVPTAIKRDLPNKKLRGRSRIEVFVSLGRMASFLGGFHASLHENPMFDHVLPLILIAGGVWVRPGVGRDRRRAG